MSQCAFSSARCGEESCCLLPCGLRCSFPFFMLLLLNHSALPVPAVRKKKKNWITEDEIRQTGMKHRASLSLIVSGDAAWPAASLGSELIG